MGLKAVQRQKGTIGQQKTEPFILNISEKEY
jgi:hypothetical protein